MKTELKNLYPSEAPQFLDLARPGKFSYKELRLLLAHSVVEIVFARRGWPFTKISDGRGSPWRRMLCTSDWKFLDKERRKFRFSPPRGKYGRTRGWYEKRKLLIVWDLVRRDWRHVSADEYSVISYLSIASEGSKEAFLLFYQNMRDKNSEKKLLKLFDV